MNTGIKKIFIGLVILLTSIDVYGSEEWWLLDAKTKECKLPPSFRGQEANPHMILKMFKGCKIETLENTDEVVFVACKGDLDTTLVFTTSLKACNVALKALKRK